MQKLAKSKVVQIGAIVVTSVLSLAPAAFAQYRDPNAAGTGLSGGLLSSGTASGFIIGIINIALAVAGLIAVLFLIIGGFRYITSGGNDASVTSAKNTILYAIIGLVVVALSQLIVRFTLNKLTTG